MIMSNHEVIVILLCCDHKKFKRTRKKKKDNALPRRASVIVSLAEIYNLLIFVQMRRVRGLLHKFTL